MKCLYTSSLVELLSEAVTCCREKMYVAAGMWLNEARDTIPHIADQKTALRLWEAVYEAIEASQHQTAVANALHQLRGPRSNKRAVGVSLGPTLPQRGRVDSDLLARVP